jgi:hypothetical protein
MVSTRSLLRPIKHEMAISSTRTQGIMGVGRRLLGRIERFLDGRGSRTQASVLGCEALEARQMMAGDPGLIQVGSQEQVNTEAGTQNLFVSSVPLSDGGYVVTWRDGSDSILGRIYDDTGKAVGDQFLLFQDTVNSVWDPRAAALAEGGFVVTWGGGSDGDGDGIFAMRFDNDGVSASSLISVNDVTTNYQSNARVSGLNDGGFVISWETMEASDFGVYARIFDDNGVAVDPQFRVATNSKGNQSNASIAALSTGGFVIAWENDNSVVTNIYTQIFAEDGAKVGAALNATGSYGDYQAYPSVVGRPDGGYGLAYSGTGTGSDVSSGIYLLSFDGANNNTGYTPVNEYETGLQVGTSLTALNFGRYLVTWNGESAGDNLGINARIFDAGFSPLSSQFLANTYTTGVQAHSTAVAYGDSGGFAIVWLGDTDEFFTTNVNQQIYTTAYGPVRIGANEPRTAYSDQLTYTLDLRTLFATDYGTFDDLGFSANLSPAWGDATLGSPSIVDGILEVQLNPQTNGDVNIHIEASQDGIVAYAEFTLHVRATEGVIPGEDVSNVIDGVPSPVDTDLLSDGRTVVVWAVENVGIYGHFVNDKGQEIGNDFLLSSNTDAGIYSPTVSVSALPTGGFIVAWQTRESISGNTDVVAQIFNADGTASSSVIHPDPDSAAVTLAYHPQVQVNSDGDFTILWMVQVPFEIPEGPFGGGGGTGYIPTLFGRNYSAAGSAVTSKYSILEDGYSIAEGMSFDITALNDDQFVVAWGNWQGGGYGVNARIFDNDGTPQGASFLASNVTLDQVGTVKALALSTGGFAITWEAVEDDAPTYDIFASVYSADGTVIREDFRLHDSTGGQQNTPRVAALADGNFVVAWNDEFSGNNAVVLNDHGVNIQSTHVTYSGESVVSLNSFGTTGFYLVYSVYFGQTLGRSFDFAPIPNIDPIAYPIPTVVLSENGANTEIDMANYFYDTGELTFEILSNTNVSVIDAVLDGSKLLISSYVDQEGTGIITVRATDAFGASVDAQVYIAVSAAPERIAYPLGPSIVANDSVDGQFYQDVATWADGSYVVVWQAGNGDHIVGRRYDAAGLPLAAEFTIDTTTFGSNGAPSVSASWNGTFVVTWDHNDDIYARRYDAAGAPIGAEFLVNTTSTGAQTSPVVSSTNDGRFIIVWESDGTKVMGATFNADGTVAKSEFALSQGVLGGNQYDVSVAMNPDDGSFVAVWASDVNDMGDIYGRIFAIDGKSSGDFLVNTTTQGCQCEPAVSINSAGDYVVVWNGDYEYAPLLSGIQVFGQRYQFKGAVQGSEFLPGLDKGADSFDTQNPDVGVAADGSFSMVWQELNPSGPDALIARHYDNTGFPAGLIIVNQDAERSFSSYVPPRIGVAPDGRFVVAWYSQDNDAPDGGLAINAQSYVMEYELLVDGIPNTKIVYGTEDWSTDLYYAFTYSGDYDLLTFTVTDNTNPALFSTDIDKGYLDLLITAGILGSSSITVRATTPSGYYQETTFTAEVAKLEATITLNDTDKGALGNIYDPALFGEFEVIFVGLAGAKNASILSDYSFNLLDPMAGDFGDFTISITHTAGKAAILLSGISDCGCPIEGTLYINVLDTIAPEFEGFKAIASKTTVPVGSVDVFFSEAIDVGSFNWESVTLTRDGGANLIDASTGAGLTLQLVSGNRYRIAGLGGLTNHVGDFVLTLVDGGVMDPAGNKMATGGEIDWTMRAAVPSAPVLGPSNPGPYEVGYTSSTTPTIIGAGTPGSTVEFYDQLDQWLGWAVVDDGGLYSFTFGSLGLGTYQIKALATSPNGYVSPFSSLSTIHIADNFVTALQITQFPTPVSAPVTAVGLKFSGLLNLASFTWQDLDIRLNGSGPNLANSSITIEQAAPGSLWYRVNLPGPFTTASGVYTFEVKRGGVLAADGKPIYSNVATSWTRNYKFVQITQFPTPVTASVTLVNFQAGVELDLASLSWQDIELTVGGGPDLSMSGITIERISPTALWYRITLPASLSVPSGDYTLKIKGADVLDKYGTAMGGDISTTWKRVYDFTQITQFPTSVFAPVVAVGFLSSTALSNLSWDDIELKLDGGPDLSTSAITVERTAPGSLWYRINIPVSMTTASGVYTLRVKSADITDAYGNPMGHDISTTWTREYKFNQINQFPTPVSTPMRAVGFQSSVGLDLSSMDWMDIELTLNGGPDLSMAGITFTRVSPTALWYVINLPSALTTAAGTYAIKVKGAGVLDMYGHAISGDIATTWTKV